MSPSLPSAAEQAQHLWIRGRQVFRPDHAQRRNADLLDYAIRYDRDRLHSLEGKQNQHFAVTIAGRHGKNPPPLHSGSEGEPGHVGCDSQSPDTGTDAAAFLGLHAVSKAGMLARFDWHVGLAARAIDGLAP